MRPKPMVAGILIALCIVAFAYQIITYTTREKTVDMGPLQVATEKPHTIPLLPIVGAIALVGGITLLLMEGETSQPRGVVLVDIRARS